MFARQSLLTFVIHYSASAFLAAFFLAGAFFLGAASLAGASSTTVSSALASTISISLSHSKNSLSSKYSGSLEPPVSFFTAKTTAAASAAKATIALL